MMSRWKQKRKWELILGAGKVVEIVLARDMTHRQAKRLRRWLSKALDTPLDVMEETREMVG